MTSATGFAGTLATPATRARCHEQTRTERGYERCHRDEHGPGTRHHVRDRSWLTGSKTPQLQLCQPCDPGCTWPDEVTPYLGIAPNRGAGCLMPSTAQRTKRWTPAQTGE